MTVPLDKEEVCFGRSEDSDVVLVADEVSRHHARICRRGDMVVLLDQKSLNGTYVNRQRIVERVLTHMDEVWFGSKCRVIYRDDTKLGRKEHAESPVSNSGTLKNLDKIRSEMERVGNSMTMIGKPTVGTANKVQTIAPQTTEEEMLKMGQAFRRLNALWRASNIMSSNFDLRQRLTSVLDLVTEILGADRGFVMLREPGTHNLNVKVAREMGRELEASSPSMGIAGRAAIDGEPVLMNDQRDQEFAARESIIQSAITSAMCVPLRIHDKLIGSIYIDTRKAGVAFADEDLELFNAVAAQAAVAIDHVDLHNQLVDAEKKRQDFCRFLSPDVVEKIMQDETDLELGGQKTTATTMFCDIRGFTNLSENMTPQEIVAMLNEHFTAVTEIIFDLNGTINKFIGDEVMCVFGAPFPREDDEIRAVQAALAIQQRVGELNRVREREGRPSFLVGVGIETGEVSAGYIGSPMRMEYTVIGDRVNVASRLCSKAAPGQVVVGPNTWEKIAGRVEGAPIGEVALKGKALPMLLHEVTALK